MANFVRLNLLSSFVLHQIEAYPLNAKNIMYGEIKLPDCFDKRLLN